MGRPNHAHFPMAPPFSAIDKAGLDDAINGLSPRSFNELEDIVERLLSQSGSDTALSEALDHLDDSLWIMLLTLACGDGEKLKLLAVRHWLISVWPSFRKTYYERKEVQHDLGEKTEKTN